MLEKNEGCTFVQPTCETGLSDVDRAVILVSLKWQGNVEISYVAKIVDD